MGFIAVNSNAIGTAMTIANNAAEEILANEYNNPGISCPVSINPINAKAVDIGEGTNNGVVSIELICHISKKLNTPNTFFIIHILSYVMRKVRLELTRSPNGS